SCTARSISWATTTRSQETPGAWGGSKPPSLPGSASPTLTGHPGPAAARRGQAAAGWRSMADPSSAPGRGGGGSASLIGILRNWLKGLRGTRNGEGSLREALGELIDETDAAAAEIDPQERALLANILALHELTAEDVIVPRADIVAVEHTDSLDELLRVMSKEAHSRIPVYRESL